MLLKPSTMRRFLLCLLAITPATLADVEFISPAAGASIPAGAITVTWKDSGRAPAISALQSYTLQILVGGNDPADAQPLLTIGASPGLYSAGNSATGTIPPTIAQSLVDGFYLQMISTAKDGGTVTNYSPRFTITGLTGVTNPKYVQQVNELGGTTSGPDTVNDVVPKADPVAPAPVAPAAAGFDVPYNRQEGPTKYAPMQPVPPTKITAQGKPTPLFPTSAFNIAKGKLPPAQQVISTVTASQTFSVQSIENTIAAQSNPRDDMAKFLARWKD